ncbi:hypothetical protein OIU76_016742 [Salix suchowensis]|nr:hypothetical protein OIU76_016742 [Salix suchowensis]
MCLGTIRFFLLSLAAFPANSSTSLQEPGNPPNWKLQPCFMRSRHGLSGLWFPSSSLSRRASFL